MDTCLQSATVSMSNGQYVKWTVFSIDSMSTGKQYVKWSVCPVVSMSNSWCVSKSPKNVVLKKKKNNCIIHRYNRTVPICLFGGFSAAISRSVRQRHPDAAGDLWCRAREPARAGIGAHEGLGHGVSRRENERSRHPGDPQQSEAV